MFNFVVLFPNDCVSGFAHKNFKKGYRKITKDVCTLLNPPSHPTAVRYFPMRRPGIKYRPFSGILYSNIISNAYKKSQMNIDGFTQYDRSWVSQATGWRFVSNTFRDPPK